MIEREQDLSSVVRRVGIFSWSMIGLALLVALIVFLLVQGRVILAPLLIAVVFIFVLNPLVGSLNRRGVPRVIGWSLASMRTGNVCRAPWSVCPTRKLVITRAWYSGHP